jgi:hypothetical protein
LCVCVRCARVCARVRVRARVCVCARAYVCVCARVRARDHASCAHSMRTHAYPPLSQRYSDSRELHRKNRNRSKRFAAAQPVLPDWTVPLFGDAEAHAGHAPIG